MENIQFRMNLIETNLQKIFQLCKKYRVKTLCVFGSILTDKFNKESDIDFLVDFEPYDPDSMDFDYCRNYWNLQEELESLLGREIDLVEEKGMKNKYFIENVNATKQFIYG